MMRRTLLLLLLCLLPVAAPASVADPAMLKQIEAYFNGLTTLTADFTQVAPDGSLATGKFTLSRPGKMRWEYNPPTPLLMLMNGSTLVYYDKELEQVSHIPVEDTLADFIAQENIRFSAKSITITGYGHKDGAVRLSLVQTGKEDMGQLTLVFTDAPISLRKMEVTDATGQTTEISLANQHAGVSVKNTLFYLENPTEFFKRN